MNSANDKYGSSLDRPPGAGKPVDPATRLSELLAQSLEELTRPFDPARPGQHPSQPVARDDAWQQGFVPQHEPPAEPQPELSPEQVRVDADKALAELEAELFAAAQQVDRDATIPHEDTDPPAAHGDSHGDAPVEAEMAALLAAHPPEKDAAPEGEIKPETVPLAPAEAKAAESEPAPDAAASAVIARVRKLMLISMAVTVIAVGSVFGFIGYRIFKGEGMVEKKADKLPESSPIPTDVTLSLPRGAKVIQSAVANDRLIMTLEIDGKIEVRTFDVNTLQPAGRLNFSATPLRLPDPAQRPPEKIALAELHAAMAQDVVGRGGVEIEIRQREADEIVRALERHGLLRADREGDVLGRARVDLRRREAFDVVDRLGDARLQVGE